MRRKKLVLITGLAILAVAVAGAFLVMVGGPIPGFYTPPPNGLSSVAGSTVRTQPFDTGVPGARAWRVLYRSTGMDGTPVAVSGVVIAPRDDPPAGGYPVVAWAHPTTGIARRCAPSLESDFGATIPGAAALIKRGFVIAATDYVGLGGPGTHPYLVGTSAARSVLDSVRAAASLVSTSGDFVVWGHSQGGHAALWTGELARDYAPELKLRGVAAAAPASELAPLFVDDIDTTGGEVFATLALLSWAKVYKLDISTVMKGTAMPSAWIMGSACLTGSTGLLTDSVALHLLPQAFLKADPTKIAPWKSIVAENTPRKLPPGLPVLIAQGSDDSVIEPEVTRNFARGLCRSGVPVKLLEIEANHLSIASLSADRVVAWLSARAGGDAVHSDCMMLDSAPGALSQDDRPEGND